MKINTTLNKILFCLILLLIHLQFTNENLATSEMSSLMSQSDKYMLLNTFLHINDEIKTKGDLILDFNKKGIILKFKDNKYLDKINKSLRDFTNKEDNEYLIDFRLINDCNFKIKNNSISLIVNKLENKLNFFLKNSLDDDKKEEEILLNLSVKFILTQNQEDKLMNMKDIFNHHCKMRKKFIKEIKENLFKYVNEEHEIQNKIKSTKKILSEKNLRKESINFYLDQTNQFLFGKNSLRELNVNQIEHLNLLKKKSIKLRKKQINQQNFIQEKLNEIKNSITYIENEISLKQKDLDQSEKEINNLNEDQISKQKELINLNKNYLELEEIFNKIITEKDNLENDLTELKRNKNYDLEEKRKLQEEVIDSHIQIKKENEKIIILENKNKNLEKLNISELNKTSEIDKKINELLNERKKINTNVRDNMDKLKSNLEEISKKETNVNEHNYKISLMKMKISDKEKNLKDLETKNEFLSKQKNEIMRKFKTYQDNLSHSYKTKEKINEEIKQFVISYKDQKEEVEKQTEKLRKITLDKNKKMTKKSNLEIELKRIQSNLSSSDIELQNYDYEIKKRKLNEEEENIEDKKVENDSGSLLNAEYMHKNILVKTEINKVEQELSKLKSEEKKIMTNYNHYIEDKILKEIPESRVLLDLIIDDLKTYSNLNKIKKLIDLIKN